LSIVAITGDRTAVLLLRSVSLSNAESEWVLEQNVVLLVIKREVDGNFVMIDHVIVIVSYLDGERAFGLEGLSRGPRGTRSNVRPSATRGVQSWLGCLCGLLGLIESRSRAGQKSPSRRRLVEGVGRRK
jgi:hypothetical protein